MYTPVTQLYYIKVGFKWGKHDVGMLNCFCDALLQGMQMVRGRVKDTDQNVMEQQSSMVLDVKISSVSAMSLMLVRNMLQWHIMVRFFSLQIL